MDFQRIKHKPAPFEEQAELVDNFGQSHFVRAGGVHGLDPVVVGLGEEGVGGVHLVEKLRHDAPDLLPSATLCVLFAVMLIFAEKRALEILRHGRGEELDGIGLVVGLGGFLRQFRKIDFLNLDGSRAFWRLPFGQISVPNDNIFKPAAVLINNCPVHKNQK